MKRNVTFSLYQLVQFAFIFWIIALPLSFFIFGDGPHSNFTTMFLGTLLAVVLLLGVRATGGRGGFPVIGMLSYMSLLHFFPRIWQYLSVQRSGLYNLYILFPFGWNPSGINAGLIYLLISTTALISGIIICVRHVRRKCGEGSFEIISSQIPRYLSLIFAGMVIYVVDGFFTIYHGMSASSNCTDLQVPGVWLIHFFSGDIFIFAIFTYFAPRVGSLNRKQVLFFALNMILYVIYMLLLGSRGGVFRLLTIFYCTNLVIFPNRKYSLKSIFGTAFLVVLSSAILYFAGNAIRLSKGASCGDSSKVSYSSFLKSLEASLGHDLNAYTRKFTIVGGDKTHKSIIQWKGVAEKLTLPYSVISIFDRLGLLDYVVGVSSIEPDIEAKEKYMNFEYMAKNFINNILLGEPYPEAHFMTSNMMPILYRGKTYKHIEENFLVDAWTLWGTLIFYMGFFWANITFVFVGFSVQFLFYMILLKTPRRFNLSMISIFLWIGLMGCLFSHMSIDHASILWVYALLQYIVTFGLIFGVDELVSFLKKKISIYSRRGL